MWHLGPDICRATKTAGPREHHVARVALPPTSVAPSPPGAYGTQPRVRVSYKASSRPEQHLAGDGARPSVGDAQGRTPTDGPAPVPGGCPGCGSPDLTAAGLSVPYSGRRPQKLSTAHGCRTCRTDPGVSAHERRRLSGCAAGLGCRTCRTDPGVWKWHGSGTRSKLSDLSDRSGGNRVGKPVFRGSSRSQNAFSGNVRHVRHVGRLGCC